MENYEDWKNPDLPVLGPYPIARADLDRMLIKAYNITREPRDYYPTVEDIDDLIESEPFQRSVWVREDAFKLFIMCTVWGFRKDDLWHKAHPGSRKATAENIMRYITTPYTGDDSDVCHVGVWDESASDELKEDRQAAFEYMQFIIMDPSVYVIVSEKKDASCA